MKKLKRKTIKFYLKNVRNGWGSIVAVFNFGYMEDGKYKFFQYSTGEDVPVEAWDSETHFVKKGAIADSEGIIRRLNKIEIDIVNAYESLEKQDAEITPDSLRRAMNGQPEKKVRREKVTLTGFAEEYIKTCKKNPRTCRHYTTTLRILKKFARMKRLRLNFNDIDMEFYRDFIEYLKTLNLRINTIGGHVKNLKVFLRQSYNTNKHTNTVFQLREFAVLSEDVDSIYLDKRELMKLYNVDLSGNKTLAETRDGFLIAAFTGLRYSDIENLKPENFGLDGIITITTLKTTQPVCIPVGEIVQEIFDKYYPKLPRIITNQKFNDYLKIIAEKAELVEEVTITRSNGGIHVAHKFPKFKLVTTHTARRSFATNMALSGVAISKIMAITGHKTQKAFYKYIKIRPKENAMELKNHPYLKLPGKKRSKELTKR